ncbi:MAG TPA: LamG-like jellyroll fold domain-containing protein [Alphaproteobacteria bacterium]|nr:LamG-like jellyroll fold domain-containing protein [Alphaproteobacteria bacterium]
MIQRQSTILLLTVLSLLLMVSQLQAAQAQLSWSAPTTNADGSPLKDLAGYKVYYGLASRSYGTPIDVGNTTIYTITGLTGGVRYYFAVKAYDTSRNDSAFSAEVSFVPPLDPSLVANFTATPTSGTAPLAVTFTDTSTGTVTITSWSWKFGDGGTSTQRNVTYTYKNPGTYDVTLTVSGGGLSNTVTKKGYITVSQAPASSSGLVAAYSFDEGTGTKVNDASGKGNHGTISGATWTSSGRFGKALVFDGVNDLVTVNDAPSLDLTTGMTLEAWVYPTATTYWRTVVLKERPGHLTYALYASSSTNQPLVQTVLTNSSNVKLPGPSTLPTNTWTHLAATYNGSVLQLYVNGAQLASRSVAGTVVTSSNPLRIGGNSVWGEYFQGRIDEVRIYNRALSASEIQADMQKGISATTSGALMVQNPRAPLKLGDLLSALGKSTPSLGSTRQQTASGSTTSRLSTTTTASSGLLTSDHIEIGEVMVDHQWKRVDLSKPFTDPIVVAKTLSYREATPAVVSIRQTDATGFEIRLQPWDGGSRTLAPETVDYLVIERGRFRLAGGASLESGTIDADPAYPVHSIAFSQPFRLTPVVLTAITNAQESVAATGRPTLVSQKGFQFRLQPQGIPHSLDALQTISYLAWEPSKGALDDLAFEVNRTRDVTRWRFSTLTFTEPYADAPVFLADIQSSQGGSPINVRWEQKDLVGIDLKIDDVSDLDADRATPLSSDVVGYIVIR